MKNHKNIFIACIVLIASTLACNLQNVNPQASAPEIQTAAALTVQAILTPSITATVQQQAEVVSATSMPAGTASSNTITPTYSVPMLTLREQTNCRAGPGQSYEILFTYLKGVRLEIVGYYPQENYWLVKSNDSPTGTCWLWGEYADVSGSYWVVSSVTPPATATLPPPTAPAVKWEFSCDYVVGQMEVSLTWTDNAANETGYRVIRNNESIIELPADSTAYKDIFAFVANEKVLYQIEVYNITGSTRSAVISVTC